MGWDIAGCSPQCINCSREFLDGHPYHCRLFLETEGPRREDYCEECWEKVGNIQISPSRGYSYWKGRFKFRPQPVEEELIKEPILKQLLKKWIHSQERLHKCFCYVIALALERKKIFQEKPKIKAPGGTEQLVYEDRNTGQSYILEDPGLTLKELTQIEKDLQDMLKQELDGYP